jgi:hypothetical protein
MKSCLHPSLLLWLAARLTLGAQGTFQYDQQSVPADSVGGNIILMQSFSPLGQSFAPSLTSLGFVRLVFYDANSGNGLGATVYVNLRRDSITGAVLGSTPPVFMPDGFDNWTNFFFSSPVSVTPGTTYYMEPVVQSGDSWYTGIYNYGYPLGTAYTNGLADPALDLWFREGVYGAPEPSVALLVLLGGANLMYIWREQRKVRSDG